MIASKNNNMQQQHYHRSLVGVLEDQDDGVSSEEHLRYVAILVHRPRLLGALSGTRGLRPHLLDVLENHVAVPVECLYAGQQLVVVAAINKDLGVKAGSKAHGEKLEIQRADLYGS